MTRKIVSTIIVLVLGFLWTLSVCADAPAPSDPKKHTPQGKYLTAREAYERWLKNPGKITIIDCRTPEEYVYLGHPGMAINIPSQIWTGKFDPEKKDVVLADNPQFVSNIKERFQPDDTILMMCRSGQRSAVGAKLLDKEGFTNIYNIVDGFEGDKTSDSESYFEGQRMKNGWKNSGAPWTYGLDIKLMPFMSLK